MTENTVLNEIWVVMGYDDGYHMVLGAYSTVEAAEAVADREEDQHSYITIHNTFVDSDS
jgi:hypothetical protein